MAKSEIRHNGKEQAQKFDMTVFYAEGTPKFRHTNGNEVFEGVVDYTETMDYHVLEFENRPVLKLPKCMVEDIEKEAE